MKSVAILGCGPAGLMAAHAASMTGWNFVVYSNKMKSNLYGAQYLHQPIPAVNCGSPKVVKYKLIGSPESYRRKVYGDAWDGTVSPDDLLTEHYAWDIRAAYDDLWGLYRDYIWDGDLSGGADWVRKVYALDHHDVVISTVPRKLWAEPGDVFESSKIWALGDTEVARVWQDRPDAFTVVCNGEHSVPWYRISNVFGYATMEWPYNDWDAKHLGRPAPGVSVVEKPLRHNSTAAEDFVHLGRYGAWGKGILSHEVFYETMKVLARDGI